jgi:protease II
MRERYIVTVWHSENYTTFYVVDTSQPEREQPCIIHAWSDQVEPNASFLARDFCMRHNAKEVQS